MPRSSAETFASNLPDPGKADMQTVLTGLGTSQLEFFDDLERQPLVCHDDALHACLLMGAGINATTFDQRKSMAQKLGWISPVFDRPPREAITIGEACTILARMMDPADSDALTQEQAVARIALARGLPENLKPYQGITGSQLLSVLGAVHDSVTPAQAAPAPTIHAESAAHTLPDTQPETIAPIADASPLTPITPVIPIAAHPHAAPEPLAEPVAEVIPAAPLAPAHITPAPVEHSSSIVITTIGPDMEAPAAEPVAPDALASSQVAPEAVTAPQSTPAPAPAPPIQAEPAQPAPAPEAAAQPTAQPAAAPVPARSSRPAQFRPGTPVKKPGAR